MEISDHAAMTLYRAGVGFLCQDGLSVVTQQEVTAALKRRVVDAPTGWLIGILGGVMAYLVIMRLGTGANRPEQFVITGVMVGLAVWSDGTRAFLRGTLPLFLWGIAYDLMHITQPLVRHLQVHIAEPYQFDLRYFGIETAQGRVTPNQFFQRHHL
jgi:hypothetical protein